MEEIGRERRCLLLELFARQSRDNMFDLEQSWWKLKHDLYRSREYYGVLHRRYSWLSWIIRGLEGILAYLLFRVPNISESFPRILLIVGVGASALKGELAFPHRVKVLKRQYREVGALVNDLESVESRKSDSEYERLKKLYAGIEKSDYPTIPCLDAVCWTRASAALGSSEYYELSLFQRTVGTWLYFVTCDESQRKGSSSET